MLFGDHLVVVRGGGDLGTGTAYRLHKAGFPVIVLDLARPLAIRRAVAFSTAITDGEVDVDGVVARLAADPAQAVGLAGDGVVAVMAAAQLPSLPAKVIVDARLAKRNIDTTIDQAPLVVALGPGFVAGADCDAVVETMRGHHLGRVLWQGSAAPDTGVPGVVGGKGAQRVVRAPADGIVRWDASIGDEVGAGEAIGTVGDTPVYSPLAGVARGLIAPGHPATTGLKIGDVDPRGDRSASFEISDKALAVGGGVVEAVLSRVNRAG